MQTVNLGGPPTPPFRHKRGGYRGGNKGCLGFWSAIGPGEKIKLSLLLLGFVGSLAFVVWLFWPQGGGSEASAQEITPVVVTLAPLETAAPAETAPPSVNGSQTEEPTVTPTTPLEPAQIAATATFQAAISRPAGNPETVPYFVGIISYEDGCLSSNLGFTTSGYSGKPYYLYLREPLDRDPFMQMVQITGYVQRMQGCTHPVLVVEQLHWIGNQGTPSPLATIPITATAPITTWGQLRVTPVVTRPAYVPVLRDLPGIETPIATYTPYPTYTPQPAPATAAPLPTLKPLPTYTAVWVPTYTPYPTFTPIPPTHTPTATHTPTPVLSNIIGKIVTLPGCPVTNLGLDDNGTLYYLILDGPTLPSDPQFIENAVVQGVLETVCGGPAIRANHITWYTVATLTRTPTVTITPTATLTATAVITQ